MRRVCLPPASQYDVHHRAPYLDERLVGAHVSGSTADSASGARAAYDIAGRVRDALWAKPAAAAISASRQGADAQPRFYVDAKLFGSCGAGRAHCRRH